MRELKEVQIIGCGNIGTAVMNEMIAREKELVSKNNIREQDKNIIWGVDIDETKHQVTDETKGNEYDIIGEIKTADAHIISVYTTEQVFEVLNKIPLENDPYIFIESTINPKEFLRLENWQAENKANIVIFPHRFNPGDPTHAVFNQFRIAGIMKGNHVVVQRLLNRYTKMVVYSTPKVACLSKPMENAYRFMEIAIAEEIKMLCDDYGIDHKELAFCMSTKWNIDLKEARDGIRGNCLPKDSNFIMESLPDFTILKSAKQVDEKYQYKYNKREDVKE